MKDNKPHYDHKRDTRRPRLGTIVEEDELTSYFSEKYKPKKNGVITLTKSELISSARIQPASKDHTKNNKKSSRNTSVVTKRYHETTGKDKKNSGKENKGKLKRFMHFMTIPKEALI
jgi:hypothetical protein